MNQKKLWDSKWLLIKGDVTPTNYAKRVHKFLNTEKSKTDLLCDQKCSILDNNKKVKTILDLGCGDGKDSLYFAKKNYSVTAVDFSKSALDKLSAEILKQGIQNIVMFREDLTDLKFKSKFDVIYANLSLHYFNDEITSKIFSDLSKLLKPKGYLFVRCKSVDDFLYDLGKPLGNGMFDKDGKTQHFFSMDYLVGKLSKFKIIRLRRTTSKHLIWGHKMVKSRFVEATAQKK